MNDFDRSFKEGRAEFNVKIALKNQSHFSHCNPIKIWGPSCSLPVFICRFMMLLLLQIYLKCEFPIISKGESKKRNYDILSRRQRDFFGKEKLCTIEQSYLHSSNVSWQTDFSRSLLCISICVIERGMHFPSHTHCMHQQAVSVSADLWWQKKVCFLKIHRKQIKCVSSMQLNPELGSSWLLWANEGHCGSGLEWKLPGKMKV